MITQEKFKLFSNDPIFRNITKNNTFAQQIAIQKVFAGQKQIRRNNIIKDSIAKKSNPNLGKPDLQIDFIQSRIHAFEMTVAEDIQKMYEQVEFIKQTNQTSKSIEMLIDSRLKQLLIRAEQVDNLVGEKEQQQLKIVEAAVNQIQELFKQNMRLKEENSQITARIQKKKVILSRKSNKLNINTKFQKR